MKIKCGTDIIEISRIKQSIESSDKFVDRVFTPNEIKYCESKNANKYEHYAARFAAKEAVFKAISDMLKNKYEITWQDIEIENRKNGKPYVKIGKIDKNSIKSIDISLSHCKEYATANVVILVEQIEYFDSHAHYDDEKFDEDRESVIEGLKTQNVTKCINVGCDIQTSINSIELSKKYDFIYATVGIHPSEIAKNEHEIDKQINELENLAKTNEKVVAVGEIGLDYHWEKENKELQKYAFIKQIELANKLGLPISIHTREAIDDTISIIKNKIKIKNGGVLHCCPFNRELVKHGLEAGLHIAFGGTCTFKNSKNADEIIKMVPINRILIETDSPYLAPDPVRGTRNNSTNLKYVVKKIATVLEKSEEEIAQITYQNATRLFLEK